MGYRNSNRRRRRQNSNEASVQQVIAHFKNQDDSAYAEALVGLFSKSNTILSGREIQCSLSETVQIAATDGSIIYFNVGQVAALVRGLRIQRRIPTEEEFRQACLALQNGNWQELKHNVENDRAYGHPDVNRYLFRKFRVCPELFGTDWLQPTGFSPLGRLGTPRKYEEFVQLLARHELSGSIKSFASLRGLNYHELSHCLFTPSATSSLRRQVADLANRLPYPISGADADLTSELAGFTRKEIEEEKALKADMPLTSGDDYDKWLERSKAWNAKREVKKYRRDQICRLLSDHNFWHKMWNTLEDQRIESLFVAKFPTARHFFTATVLRFIINHRVRDENELKIFAKNNGGGEIVTSKKGTAYLLVHGRRYLPKRVRDKYRELLLSDYTLSSSAVAQVESAIDRYRALANFKSSAEIAQAVDIVWEFGCWVLRHIEEVSLIPEPEGGYTHDQHKTTGAQTKRENAEDQERRQKQEKRWESEEDQEDSDDQGDFSSSDDESEDEPKDGSDSDSDSGEESDEEDSDGDANGNSPEESDEEDSDGSSGKSGNDKSGKKSDRDGNGSQNRRHQNSDGSKAGKSDKSVATTNDGDSIDDSIRELLNQAEEAISDDALQQIDALHDLVKKERSSRFFRDLWKSDGVIPPPVLYRSLSNAISTSLAKLRSDRDNQWEKGSAVGVVNVLRYAESRGTHTDFFDEWQEDGDERPDAEICVLLDLSSSMNGESWSSYKERLSAGIQHRSYDVSKTIAYEASCAMWAIKYACQRNDIPCSVIGYSDGAYAALPIYASTDAVTSGTLNLFAGLSGTRPGEAIQIAQSVLEKSDARHRILVSLSDGDWAVYGADLKPIHTLNKLGVQTVFIQLPNRIDLDPKTNKEVPRFSSHGSHGTYAGTNGKQYYGHDHLLKVEDSSALTKRIGAILLKAVQNR